jgi:hypothetical protein
MQKLYKVILGWEKFVDQFFPVDLEMEYPAVRLKIEPLTLPREQSILINCCLAHNDVSKMSQCIGRMPSIHKVPPDMGGNLLFLGALLYIS